MRRVAVFVASALLLLVGSGLPEPVATATSQRVEPIAGAPTVVEGRSRCDGGITAVQSDLSGAAADTVEGLQAKYEDTIGFRAVVFDGEQAVVIVDPDTLDDWAGRASHENASIAPSCVSQAVIAATASAIDELDLSGSDMVSAGYDALLDAVVVTSTLSADVIRQAIVAHLPADKTELISEYTAPDETLRIMESTGALFGRLDGPTRTTDASPFIGGSRIYVNLGGGLYGGCSPAFYLNSATNGTVLVTAGHCSNGANSRTVWNGNFSWQVGQTEGAHFPNPDLAVIDGTSYAARSFAWNDQTTRKPITESADPATGVTYCQFGASSLRICAPYTSLDQTYCDPSGCTLHLAYTSRPSGPGGSLGSGGDSGGGVFRELSGGKLGARGLVVAGGCDATTCARWDHKRSTILSTYSATVVTN